MDPRTAAQMIAERFDANVIEREWIEWLITLAMPRLSDSDPTPRVTTNRRFPAICIELPKEPK